MMKPVVGIFAHPDDEAMGPSGTLALLAKTRPVYLICATDGNQGKNLKDIRSQELEASAKILGVKQVFFLKFKDGDLSNNLYHELADAIKKILDQLKPDTIITFENRGVSGHIDHITVSLVCSYLFDKLRYVRKAMYYCRRSSPLPLKNYFIYFPPGYSEREVDEVVDIKPVLKQKISAIKCHASQASDVRRVLALLAVTPKKEFFLIRHK